MLYYIFNILFCYACCGAMAILRQARIAHCSVHCSCLLGVGGMTETALTPPSSFSSFFIKSSLLSPVCCHAFTITHNHLPLYSTLKIQLSNFLPNVRYSFSFPSSKLQHSEMRRLAVKSKAAAIFFTFLLPI